MHQEIQTIDLTDHSLPTWQKESDVPFRRIIIAKLMASYNISVHDRKNTLPNLIKRIELTLYKNAFSLEEYFAESTLERRVQSFVVQLYSKINHLKNNKMSKKRKRPRHAEWTSRKFRLGTRTSPRFKRQQRARSVFLLNNQEDLLTHIFSFVEGQQVLQLSSVNHFTRGFLPKCVRNLQLNIQMFTRKRNKLTIDTMRSTLLKCHRLEYFGLTGENNAMATACNQKLKSLPLFTSKDMNERLLGEQIVLTFVDVLNEGHCRLLKGIDLNKVYLNSSVFDPTQKLVLSLLQGNHRGLEELRLANNLLGDTRAVYIAVLLKSNVCSNLRVLDLKENFIGEKGAAAILHAFEDKQSMQLVDLNLSSNILTDLDAHRILTCLKKECVPKIAKLMISDNYITHKKQVEISQCIHRHADKKLRAEFPRLNYQPMYCVPPNLIRSRSV